jgi:hypothetical protein
MIKKNTLLLIVFCMLALVSEAQVETNSRILRQAAVDFKISYDDNYARALTLARKYNWPLSFTSKKGQKITLVGVDKFDQPKYYITNSNADAAATTGANQLWPGGRTGLNLNGSSSNMKNKIAVWDGGAVMRTHVELGTDRVTQKDAASAISDHSTHVAGTMIAKGINPVAKGMAFGATGLFAFDYNNDASEMAGEAAGLLLSNHSYSYLAGWVQNEVQNNRWEFYGEVGATEDYKFGYYGPDAQLLDSIAYNAPYYLIVKSAGNNRDMNGPAVGETYYRRNSQGQMINAGARPEGISSNDGYDIISLDVGAKNILTVGAVNPIPAGYGRKEDVVMSDFSSWGPTDDGRIKPDIVADGVFVTSPISTSTTSYATYSGTSMSAPSATGSLFLLQEHYSKLKNSASAFMHSATLKGLAIHTANEAGDAPGPDYRFGWGLLNVEKAAAVLTAAVPSNNSSTSTHLVYDTTISQSEVFTKTVIASGKGPLIATICWTDPKGTIDETNKLNNRAKNLINDLDIRITTGSGSGTRTYKPWTLDVNNPAMAAVPGDNITDNVEKIEIDSTVAGTSYTITVTHKNVLARGSQAYSLLVSGVGGTAYCASAPGSNTGTRIDSVVFKNIAVANPAGNTSYTDYTNYIGIVEAGQTSPIRVKVGSSDGTNAAKMVKVFIDYDNSGSFEPSELAASSATALSNGNVFVANITISPNVAIGNLLRMRVIAQETANAGDVAACGTYGKGETEDFSLRVGNPGNDLSIIGIVSPTSFDCATDSMYLTVSIRNNGSVEQSNIPMTASIGSSAGIIANLTGIYPGTIPAQTTVVYTFQKPFTLTTATAYTITSTVSLATDQLSSNNQFVTVISTPSKPTAPDPVAATCGNVVNLKVNNPGESNYFWYTSATGDQPFASGTPATGTTATSTFYVAKGARGVVGLPNKMIYPNGGYNHFNGNYMRFSNQVPIVIETVRLYVGNPGKVEFTVGTNLVVTSTGYNYNKVSSTIIDLYATKPNPGPNSADATSEENPAADTGAIYYLGLPVYVTGNTNFISVALLYPDGTRIPVDVTRTGASLFRNGSMPGNIYPIGINQVAQFTGNSATGTNVQQSQYFYFFYNMRVSTLIDCVSDRVSVVPITSPTPAITQQADSLASSIASGNQWYINDTLIAGATGQKYKPTRNGIYKTIITDQFGCQKISNTINYVITAIDPTVAAREINLKVSPNPNNGIFNLSFEVTNRADLSIVLYNQAGQTLYSSSQANFSGRYSRQLRIPNAATGIYLLKVQHDKKNYVVKVAIQ